MTPEALIIFVRHPELGKVKTRLAREVGNETALAIYKDLLIHTREVAAALAVDRFVFYEDKVHNGDDWPVSQFNKMAQEGKTLGDRMFHSFSTIFNRGYKRVVVIGSDCLELTPDIIREAFEILSVKDSVLGPAADGGYYLLGMQRLFPAAFKDKTWSSSTVLENTLSDLEEASISVGLLPELSDIDTYSDLPASLKTAFNI